MRRMLPWSLIWTFLVAFSLSTLYYSPLWTYSSQTVNSLKSLTYVFSPHSLPHGPPHHLTWYLMHSGGSVNGVWIEGKVNEWMDGYFNFIMQASVFPSFWSSGVQQKGVKFTPWGQRGLPKGKSLAAPPLPSPHSSPTRSTYICVVWLGPTLDFIFLKRYSSAKNKKFKNYWCIY